MEYTRQEIFRKVYNLVDYRMDFYRGQLRGYGIPDREVDLLSFDEILSHPHRS